MRDKIRAISQEVYELIEPYMIEEDITQILDSHGKSTNSPRACKAGSSVYLLLSESNEVLYVGESGVSIKSRCFGDGSGAHYQKTWFQEVAKVRHFTKDSEAEFSKQERKLAEQALSIVLCPKYYI